MIRQRLDRDPIRARCLDLLSERAAKAAYRGAREQGRSAQDRNVLIEGVLPALSANEREEDGLIHLTIRLADAYEGVASLLEAAFNCLLWGLTRRGGQAKPLEIQADPRLQPVFRSLCRQLPRAARSLRDLMERVPAIPQMGDRIPLEPLDAIALQAATGGESASRLIESVITRHREVQALKGKGLWIEPGDSWTLMPGFGLATDRPPQPQVTYLHTFRVPNAYSFLADLGLSGVEVPDGEG